MKGQEEQAVAVAVAQAGRHGLRAFVDGGFMSAMAHDGWAENYHFALALLAWCAVPNKGSRTP